MKARVTGALLAALMVVGGFAGANVSRADEPGPAPTPNPTVEGPIPDGTGIHGHPWYDPEFEVASIGYVEEEYFLSGSARALTTSAANADYTTRIFVVRPDTADFNGTVVVEWDNVTAQAAFSPMFTWTHQLLLREGYAFVSVSAQAAGICCSPLAHRLWDPVRYGDLSHPGDDYSFDIYSQAIQAVKHPAGTDPMGGLDVERVIAVGQSQSAGRLHTYVNQVQSQVGLVDAFIIDAGGSKNFPSAPAVPVIHLLSEDGISAAAPNRLGHPNYRLWEVPGASHNDADTARHIDNGQFTRNSVDTPKESYATHQAKHDTIFHYGEQGPSTHAGCQVLGQGGNEYPRRYVVQSALSQLDTWIRGGTPAIQPPRVVFDGSAIRRDDFGHAVGGVRLPPLDVPVARYFPTTCALFGHDVALSPAELLSLYPTHDDYVTEMQAATDEAVAAGFMLPEDGEELMGYAERAAATRTAALRPGRSESP